MSAQVVNPTCRKVQVLRTNHPKDDRYVSLTTMRIHATNVHVVALVDGTNRLAQSPSLTLRTTTSPTTAQRYFNTLVARWGGDATNQANPRATRHPQPRRQKDGSWRVQVQQNGQKHQRTFGNEAEARHFIDTIKEEAT